MCNSLNIISYLGLVYTVVRPVYLSPPKGEKAGFISRARDIRRTRGVEIEPVFPPLSDNPSLSLLVFCRVACLFSFLAPAEILIPFLYRSKELNCNFSPIPPALKSFGARDIL